MLVAAVGVRGLELCLAIFVVMQQPFEEETAN